MNPPEIQMGCLDDNCRRCWIVIGITPDTACPFCGSLDVVRLGPKDQTA